MQRYTVYLFLETALHVSGGISTHHQEQTQLYLQHLALVKTLPLPAAIVEELERRFGRNVQTCIPDGHLHRVTYTRYRIDTIESPDDEHLNARNM
jgi:hypothetical protein